LLLAPLCRPQKDSFSVVVDMDDERPGSQARVCVCVSDDA
jgi:hypothetical protein